MREKLNSNPMVQIGVLAVLAIGVGLLLLTRMGGGSAEEAPTTPTTAATPTTAPPATPSTGAAPSTAAPTPAPATGAAPATPVAPAGDDAFTAGPGLPEPLVKAYEDGNAVVLLIYRRKGIDDVFMNEFVQRLHASNVTAVSTAAVFRTNAHNIAKYSRITEGVSVSRTPALVVIRPKKFSNGGLPLASVSYGFRDPLSVVQAVEDALYTGPQVPSYPE